jgi:formylglycine-generating enzyme
MSLVIRTWALALGILGAIAGDASALVTVVSVPVGDINNPANWIFDVGSVGYNYSIGKYEVTLNQYCAFLNAVGATDTYGLYNPLLNSLPQVRGIYRSGASGSYHYSVIGSGNRPVTYVSWFDAARFVNWLQNGQPTGLQGPATTETGVYALNGATGGLGFARNPAARFCLPTLDEWHKAAYYDPTGASGYAGYWFYPTRSNDQPNSRPGNSFDPNSANYYYDDGIANGYNGGNAV